MSPKKTASKTAEGTPLEPSAEERLPGNISAILDKVDRIREDLNTILIDRGHAITLSLLALIARENIILLGPPGTAKSLLASELCKRIENPRYFQRLLTKFTKESELFVSGQGILEENVEDVETGKPIKITRIKTFHEHMLPQATVAFLDEVFKGNSAILNSLLTLMNEKIYFTNDGRVVSSDLITLFGASNERPNPEDGLEALYDRFLIRYYVGYLKGSDFKKLLLLATQPGDLKNKSATVSVEELLTLHGQLDKIAVSDRIIGMIYEFRERLEGHPNLKVLKPSDRRMKNSLKVLRANALIHRRMTVTRADIEEVFPYILWDTSPGVSNNLRVQMLEELIVELKKENARFQEILDYGEKCDEYRKQFVGKHNSIRDAKSNPANLKARITEFDDQFGIVSSELETYKKEIERAAASSDYDPGERSIANNILENISALLTDIESQIHENYKILRAMK